MSEISLSNLKSKDDSKLIITIHVLSFFNVGAIICLLCPNRCKWVFFFSSLNWLQTQK